MVMKKFEKLVRVKIPSIIIQNGSNPKHKLLSGSELLEALKSKAVEEAIELKGSRANDETLGELVDLAEVVDAIRSVMNLTNDELKTLVEAKRIKRGRLVVQHCDGRFHGEYLIGVEE
jgi:predicted house-cleaning noncanonical NTP pyrophosphatase (MazG superfamily)